MTGRGIGVVFIALALLGVFHFLGVIIAAQLAIVLLVLLVLAFLLCLIAWRPVKLKRFIWVPVRAAGSAAQLGDLTGAHFDTAASAGLQRVDSGVPEVLRGDAIRDQVGTAGRSLRWGVLETSQISALSNAGQLSNTSDRARIRSPRHAARRRKESDVTHDSPASLTARLGRVTYAVPRCRITDPFGLWRRHTDAKISGIDKFIVLPRILELPLNPRLVQHAAESELSLIPREYATGDEIRRVHWGASARRGRLMVRDIEPVERIHATVVITPNFMSTGEANQATENPSELVELGLNAAISLAQHGFVVRICDSQDHALTPLLLVPQTGMPGRSRVPRESIHVAQRKLALANLDDPHRGTGHPDLIESHDEMASAHFSVPSLVFYAGSGEVSTRGGNPMHPRPIKIPRPTYGISDAEFSRQWSMVLETL